MVVSAAIKLPNGLNGSTFNSVRLKERVVLGLSQYSYHAGDSRITYYCTLYTSSMNHAYDYGH